MRDESNSSADLAILPLIACANLANLLLARGASRRQQTALRLSLGATRGRLIRAVLTESVLLSLLGGMAGVFLAYVGAKAILLIAFRGANYVPIDTAPSLPVLLFALFLSLLTGVIFGVAPAWIGARADPPKGSRGSSRSNTQHSTSSQKTLVIVQAALSVVLLVVAGLVTESLRNLERASLGFQTPGASPRRHQLQGRRVSARAAAGALPGSAAPSRRHSRCAQRQPVSLQPAK